MLTTERDRLQKAIDLLESQRAVLGDAVVETALAPLRAKLTALDETRPDPDPSNPRDPSQFSGDRRAVTILFCDVRDSTAMAEKLDPEEWARTIQKAMKYMTGPVQQHDGTVAEVRGDGLLAFFGAPLAHEDDPQRGVLAGLEIIEGIQAFKKELQHGSGLDFNVRVGIHTGLVVVGEVNRRQPGEYAAFGDAVNLAARLEQTAQAGTVQISAQTYGLVKQVFDCRPLGEIKVKGKRRPVQTYRVLGLKPKSSSARGLEWHGLHSPLVGREAELRTVMASFDRLLAGQGSILGIFGEAGIGKSRLIEEAHRDFQGDRFLWLEGHSLSYGLTIPYWPFQEILRVYAGINDQDREAQAWDKLERQITAHFPENKAEILPYLASLLALPVKGQYLERVKYLDGEALGKQIFLASRRFLGGLAASRPVVLVFEDLQGMDASSVSLLEHLLPLVEQVPLLIAILSRPSWETPAGKLIETIETDHKAHYTVIELIPLSQRDSDRLVHNLLEIESLPEELQARILSRAEGNPFFLEEILRALIDLNVIQRQSADKRWRVTAQINNLAIPDTVQSVILSRLDRLAWEVKHILRIAAVIGRSFLYQVLRAVIEDERGLDMHLAELQTSELIEEKKGTPELEYIFKQALVQEVVYENILLDRRRELHAQVADAIEILFADRLEEFYGLLAHHYAEAEAWEKAQAYLRKAADQAGRISADAEALEHYRQALGAYARAFGEQWDPIERAELERKMGEALFRRGEWVEAIDFLRSALAYLGHSLPDSRWAVRLALSLEIAQEIGRSLFPNLVRAHGPGPATDEELRIYQTLKVIGAATDPEFFLLLSFRMLNFSARNSLTVGVATASAGLGIVFGEFLNLPRLAGHFLQRAVKQAEQLLRPDALGIPYTGLMTLEAMIGGKWETALEYGRRSADALHKIGNLGDYSVSIFVASTILIWGGDFARALANGQEQTRLGQDAAESQMIASGLWVQGFAERCLGRLDMATFHVKQALEIAGSAGNSYLRVLAANELSQCYLHKAEWQSALDISESNYNFILAHNFGRAPFPNAMLWNNLAAAYLLAAEQSEPGERHDWLMKAGHACSAALKWRRSLRPGAPEALRLQGRYEWLKGNALQARRWWQKSLAEAETLKMPYEVALTHLEIGQRLDERAHREQAEALLAKDGSTHHAPS